MALPTRNLDDLTYQQLFEILRADLPPEWSDHNPSDPGIALLELLCWLGEMSLYRMNRVPAAHQEKFLKLLVDPPVPVTLTATIEVGLSAALSKADSAVMLPAGLQFATDYAGGRRALFESYSWVRLMKPTTPGHPIRFELPFRAIRELRDVDLGTSTGLPHQTFPLPIQTAEEALLLDLDGSTYASPSTGLLSGEGTPGRGNDPNPRVRVRLAGTEPGEGELWSLRSSLRNPDSEAGASAAPQHFSVDAFENRVRFGDGQFGAIPRAGSVIRLEYAQLLQGPNALIPGRSLGAGASASDSVLHLLNPEMLPPGVLLRVVGYGDAQGGDNFFSSEDRTLRGLARFRDPTRLVTASDFERVVSRDFNAFQERFNQAVNQAKDSDKVGRAVALMNCIGLTPSPGHVTLLILPQAALRIEFDPDDPLSTPEASVTPSEGLKARLRAYLEPRRLLTTFLHLRSVQLRKIAARLVIVIDNQRKADEMLRAVRLALHEFFSLSTGPSGSGWPIGGAVRRSMLYAWLEALPGVDHVKELAVHPADDGDVLLGPLDLPVWNWDPAETRIELRRADA